LIDVGFLKMARCSRLANTRHYTYVTPGRLAAKTKLTQPFSAAKQTEYGP
jgi:hypothetical protein